MAEIFPVWIRKPIITNSKSKKNPMYDKLNFKKFPLRYIVEKMKNIKHRWKNPVHSQCEKCKLSLEETIDS